jgi:hypothetical protein
MQQHRRAMVWSNNNEAMKQLRKSTATRALRIKILVRMAHRQLNISNKT